MKKITLLLFLFVITCLHAQMNVGNVSLDFGEDISDIDGNVLSIAGVKDNVIYTLSKRKKEYLLQTFDEGSKRNLNSISLKLDKIEDSKITIEDVVVIDNRVYVMASYFNKAKKQNKFVAMEVSSNLSLGDPKEILTVDVPSRKNRGLFLFKMSYDEVNYMVVHVGIIAKKELLTYDFTLLDGAMNQVMTNSHSESFQDRKDLDFDFADFDVNERGDVFIVLSDSYRDKKNKTTKNRLSLHTYYSNNAYNKQEVIIDLQGKKVLNCDMIYTGDKLQLIGFYSNLRKSGRSEIGLEGIFDIAVNTKDNSIIKKVFNDFTLETKTKLLGERRANKGKDLKPFYRNTHLVERSNGGVIVLSEYFLSIQGRSSGLAIAGVGVTATPITYRTNEIIVTALAADGTLEWSNVIPKEQQLTISVVSVGLVLGGGGGNVSVSAAIMFPVGTMGDGPEYLSSVPLYKDGKLTVIVNDDPKNVGIVDIDDVKKVRNINKMIPVAFEFDDITGEMTRIDPEDYEKKQIVLRPGVTYFMNNDELIIYGSSRSETKLGTLKL